MNLTRPKSIDELIIKLLATSAENAETLLVTARKTKPGFTKQALYVILRKLIKEEVVVKYGTQFSLSSIWINKMADFFAVVQERYDTKREGSDFLLLTDGDRISYNFKSPTDADKFWGHAFGLLSETMSSSEAVYIYNPHEWFILARHESEYHLMQKFKEKKRSVWITTGNNTALDLYARQFFDGIYVQYHALKKPIFKKETYYVNIFGSYIVEAYLDIQTAEAINAFYITTKEWGPEAEHKLKTIVSKGKTKITISNNKNKAEKLKKLLGKYFYIPK